VKNFNSYGIKYKLSLNVNH